MSDSLNPHGNQLENPPKTFCTSSAKTVEALLVVAVFERDLRCIAATFMLTYAVAHLCTSFGIVSNPTANPSGALIEAYHCS